MRLILMPYYILVKRVYKDYGFSIQTIFELLQTPVIKNNQVVDMTIHSEFTHPIEVEKIIKSAIVIFTPKEGPF